MDSNTLDVFIKELGLLVVKHRRGLGLSQADLAQQAGIHRTYVSDVENGKRNISLGTLYSLSDSLGLSIAELVKQASKHNDQSS